MKNKIKFIIIRDLVGGGAERFVSELFSETLIIKNNFLYLIVENNKINRSFVKERSLDLNYIKFLKWDIFSFIKEIVKIKQNNNNSIFISFLNSSSLRMIAVKIILLGNINIIICQRSHPIECLEVENMLSKIRHFVLYIVLYNLPNKIICNSYSSMLAVKKFKLNKKNCIFADTWIVPFRLIEISKKKIKNEISDYYCCVGSLTKIKGVERVIESFIDSNLNSNIYLKIIGEGPFLEFLNNLVIKQNQQNRIIFEGWSDNPFEIIRNSRGLILGSNTEGCSNVVSEALALGTTVFISEKIFNKFSNPFNNHIEYYSLNNHNTLCSKLSNHIPKSKIIDNVSLINYRKTTINKFIKLLD